MATMAAPHQPRYDLEDPGFPRNAREAREAARAARNGSSPRYRRTQSPEQVDDYRFAGEDDMRSPTSDVALQDAMLAQAQQQQVGPKKLSFPPSLTREKEGGNNICSAANLVSCSSVWSRLVRMAVVEGSADNLQVPTT